MRISHLLEGVLAIGALRGLRIVGPERASDVVGRLARTIGPSLPVSRVAMRNLELALPELDEAGRRRIVRGVWENLGRTAGEFPHVSRLSETPSGPGWEVVGAEHVEALALRGGPAILVSAHIGNWEVLPIAAARQGVTFATVYRRSNNPIINDMIVGVRQETVGANERLFAKGAKGAREILTHLRQGGIVTLLQDQKMNDGVAATFFGRTAMTASALASLALKFSCPIIPVLARRIAPARFRITYEAPLVITPTENRIADILTLTQAVNDHLETWIRAAPESWLWLHRRWPKDSYADLR